MRVTEFAPENRAALAELWHASALSIEGAPPHGIGLAELTARVDEEIAGGWELHLAWEGHLLTAFMALKPDDGCIDQLFVAPGRQREGIGARLLDLAKARLPQGIWLRTAAESAACRFYERHGFHAGERHPHPRLGHILVVYRWP